MKTTTGNSLHLFRSVAWASVLILQGFTAMSAEGEAKIDEVPLQIEFPWFPNYSRPLDKPPAWVKLKKREDTPRTPMMVPKDVTNVALHKPVTSSDPEPVLGKPEMVTDGKKELWLPDNKYNPAGVFEVGPGRQYVQIDLGQPCEIFAVVFWLPDYSPEYIYRALVVQVAEDAQFTKGVKTLLNTDRENINGLGKGEDLDSWTTNEGILVAGRRTVARYVRLYSNGSNGDEMNRFVELEVYGRPARAKAP
jgi:hypothetical protein